MKRTLFALPVFALSFVEAETVAYWPMNNSTVEGVRVVRCAISQENDLIVNEASATFPACDIGWNHPLNAPFTATAASAEGALVSEMLEMSNGKGVGILTNGTAHLADRLSPYHDFTVEGWAKLTRLPTLSDTKDTSQMFVYMTLAEGGGWAWNLHRPKNSETLQIYVRISTDDGKGGVSTENLYFAAGLAEADMKDAWHHYALAYNRADSTWTFYLDGVNKGTGTSVRSRFDANPIQYGNPIVFLSGCKSGTAQSLIGDLACWRLSDVTLEPSDLLCGRGTTVQAKDSKTLAYWKLDNASDGHLDSIGDLNLLEGAGGVTKDADGVVVQNPDSSASFVGDSGANVGSVQIGSDWSDNNKFLYVTGQSAIQPYFRDEEGWTIEGYVKRTGGFSYRFGTIFNICYDNDGATPILSLRAKGATDATASFNLYDNAGFSAFKIDDEELCKGGDTMPYDAWTHFALSQSNVTYTNVRQVVWKFYVNGSLRKELMYEKKVSSVKRIYSLSFGGNYNTQRTFVGALDSFRLSKGALEPSEFLCATTSASAPTAVSNLAYWPMDNQDGSAFGGLSAGCPGYGFVTVDGTVSGDAAQVCRRVPAKAGLPTANKGSVVVAANSAFKAAHLGADLNFGDTWSVEGYHKVSVSGETVICGTYDESLSKGWKLILDTSGASPAYKLVAAAGDTPFVNGVFSGLGKYSQNDWNHLLLTHDRNGTWTLTVNGSVAGGLTSAPRCARVTSGASGFYIAGGQYDLWRAATGCLSVEDSIYEARKGFVLIMK